MNIETLPKLSFGCASFGNDEAYGSISQEDANKLVYNAIYDHNIRYFDTSHYYGNSEEVLGNALVNISRDDFFVGTKVGRVGEVSCFSSDFIKTSVYTSIQRLQVSYIDLVQLHDVEFGNIDKIINEGLPMLEKLKKTGLIRYIGITGLHLDILDSIIDKYDGKIDTILTYCNYGLNYDIKGVNKLSKKINGYIKKWRKDGIYIIQGGFTSMGLFTDKPLPKWHPVDDKTRDLCLDVNRICKEYNTSVVKVAFQYLYNLSDISTILVGPNNINELANYTDWISSVNSLSAELIDKITSLFMDFELWVE